jgi:hypothetical protein
MAWRRTALGVAGVSALLLREVSERPWTAVPGLLGVVLAIGLEVSAERRHKRGTQLLAQGLVRAITAVVVALTLGALALVGADLFSL